LKNYFTGIIVANGWFIATYKAMKSLSYKAEDTMAIWAEIVDDLLRKILDWLQVNIGNFLTSDRTIQGFHTQAKRSQIRQFSGDWVYKINDIDGLDLAIEFEECAVIKMYNDLGVEEMSPFCSFADVTYSTYFDIGMDATETLGLGFPTCKLYYQRRGGVKYNQQIRQILPTHLVKNPDVQAVEKYPK
jgi:hypothetical protein